LSLSQFTQKSTVPFCAPSRHDVYRIRSIHSGHVDGIRGAAHLSQRSSRRIVMENERSPMFTIALVVAIISTLGFFLLAAAAANGGM
jgi:hypothetical protein